MRGHEKRCKKEERRRGRQDGQARREKASTCRDYGAYEKKRRTGDGRARVRIDQPKKLL